MVLSKKQQENIHLVIKKRFLRGYSIEGSSKMIVLYVGHFNIVWTLLFVK